MNRNDLPRVLGAPASSGDLRCRGEGSTGHADLAVIDLTGTAAVDETVTGG
jgi:hypothetical protein